MHQCLAFLKNGRKLVFLRLTNVDPQKLSTWLFSIHVITNLEQNVMHDIKDERRSYDKEGHFDTALRF
jgi:hypothetical protein